MKKNLLFMLVLIAVLLVGCAQATPGGVPSTSASATSAPTNPPATTAAPVTPSEVPSEVTPTGMPTEVVATPTPAKPKPLAIGMAVKALDNRLILSDLNMSLSADYKPAYTSLNPKGGLLGGKAYVYDFTNFPAAMVVDENGAVQLDFVQNPTTGLAVFDGDQPKLAWGTQLKVPTTPSSLQMSAPDGSQLETLMLQGASDPAMELQALFFSADGKSLFFSREPVGLGGYILYPGVSSLYKMDLASKQVTDLIPVDLASGKASCLDAISLDDRYVADHCTVNAITIRDLSSGATSTIQPPEGQTDFHVLGSARFSPDGSQVAYALAKNNPDDEMGWVAVSDRLQGSSRLIVTGNAKGYYDVIGFLNDQTILIQFNPMTGCENGCGSELWTVDVDGSSLIKVSDGRFLAAEVK